MMKVLYVTNYPSPYAVDTFNEMGKYCDLTVTFEQAPQDVSERSKEWFEGRYENFNARFLKQDKFLNKTVCYEIKNYLKGDFDVIIMGEYSSLTEMYAINYMKRHKISYGFAIDGGLKRSGKGLKEALKRYLIRGAAFYLSSGDVTDDFLIFYGADVNKLYRYPFTSLKSGDILDRALTFEEKADYKLKLGFKEEKVILSIGQFIPRKGFDVLIKAAKRLNGDVGVYIVGGDAPEEYISLKEEMGADNVHFLPFKQKEELKRYYYASDIFALPTREDIWGLVINEAMACALPIISSDRCVAGVELVDEKKGGFITKVEDDVELAERINLILSDGKMQREMSEYNLEKIRDYTIENMAKRIVEVIKEV